MKPKRNDQHVERIKRTVPDAPREAKRSAGSVQKTKSRSAGRGRVPRSASQYRTNTSYSNRSGKNGASANALRKVCYDWMLHAVDPETGELIKHGRKKNDVAFTYAYAKPNTPSGAHKPVAVATKSYQFSRGKRGDTRQMSHHTISLPAQLNDGHLNALTQALSQLISELHDGVPVFAARHLPDEDNENHHVHIDHPIHHIVADHSVPDGFRLGMRISHFTRPSERAAMGLPKTNHQEVRELRKRIAHVIADHMERVGIEHNLCERWRHAHLRLNQGKENQVSHGVARGDVMFVRENATRAVTQHEGPGAQRIDGASKSAKAHNDDVPGLSPELLAETVLNRVIADARTAELSYWQEVELLASLYGIGIKWNRNRTHDSGKVKYGSVSGVSYYIDGVKLTGKAANMPLSKLTRHLPTLGKPISKTKIPDTAKATLRAKLKRSGLNTYNLARAVLELAKFEEVSIYQATFAEAEKAQSETKNEIDGTADTANRAASVTQVTLTRVS